MAKPDPILDAPMDPAYPVGYDFWIANYTEIRLEAILWYQRAFDRAPADSDIAHGLWRAANEGPRWGTLRQAWNDCWPGGDPDPGPIPGPKPWEDVTEEQLRKYRGAIGTKLWSGPAGYRPNQADNAIFTAMYDNPDYTADDRARILREYPYTHFAMGPLIQNGYHDIWTRTNWLANPDVFLDRVEEVWMAGKIPVVFLLDDTGVFSDGHSIDHDEVERVLTPIFSQPRWQALCRFVVCAWEPDWFRDEWTWLGEYLARVFPKALRAIHFPSGHGAPGLGSELARRDAGGNLLPGEPNVARPYLTEGEMWGGISDPSRPGGVKASVAALFHIFLQQDTYSFNGDTHEGRTPEEQVLYDAWDFIRRFQTGYGGWPTHSASGPNVPIDMVMFEYGSYMVAPSGGPGRFPSFKAASEGALDMGRQLLDVANIAGFGDGGPTDR